MEKITRAINDLKAHLESNRIKKRDITATIKEQERQLRALELFKEQ